MYVNMYRYIQECMQYYTAVVHMAHRAVLSPAPYVDCASIRQMPGTSIMYAYDVRKLRCRKQRMFHSKLNPCAMSRIAIYVPIAAPDTITKSVVNFVYINYSGEKYPTKNLKAEPSIIAFATYIAHTNKG